MLRPSVALVLVLLINTGLCFGATKPDPTKGWDQPHDKVKFNFTEAPAAKYKALLKEVRDKIIAQSSNKVYGVPVLPPQTPEAKPYRWLFVELSGRGSDTTTLAVRQDNLYVAGFTDRAGRWYVFKNRAPLNLIPGATVLSFDDDYTGLVGGYKNLSVLHLGRDASVAAVDVLANRPLADAAKTAVAVMAVTTISEASRLTPISGSIAKHWVPGGLIGDQAVLVVNWKVISCALMVSYQHDQNWVGKEADDLAKPPVNIKNLYQAKTTLQVMLWPKNNMCSEEIKWLKHRI